MSLRKEVVIIGSGWAGATLSTALDETKYSITVISPETTTPYTPLLASAACGFYDFSTVETPIRHTGKRVKFVKARAESIDFEAKTVKCIPAFDDLTIKEFDLDYDVLVIAPGCTNNTFNTPGVSEHALFLRNARDAKNVAARVQDCFEKASIPGLTDTEKRALLHFVIVGAGPTGVEVSSEFSDLFSKTYSAVYPHLKEYVTIAIHDVADQVLSGFDTKLQNYAMGSFTKRNVEVETGSHIEKVEKDYLLTKEKGRIDAGLVIWATGNKSVPLVDSLNVKKTPRNPRILTDDFLRVYSPDSELLNGVYAIGDAADVEDARLPTTAEVALGHLPGARKLVRRQADETYNILLYRGPGSPPILRLNDSKYEDGAKLPCYYVPFSPNPKFYGRGEALKTVSGNLEFEPGSEIIRSMALWATAGMGKPRLHWNTHIDSSKRGSRQFSGLLLTMNHSPRSVLQREIACILDLPGATTSKGHNQNRLLVLRLFQVTDDTRTGELEYVEDFVYLMSDTSRYLLEFGRYTTAAEVLSAGFSHCKDKSCLAYTNLCVNMGQVYCERGQDISALKHNDIVLRVRESQLDPKDPEIANALSNSALSMLIFILKFYTFDTIISYHMHSNFATREGKYDEAYSFAEQALVIANKASSTNPSVSAAFYYLGNIRIIQDRGPEAVECLEQVLWITKLNECVKATLESPLE
ncbi:hypothetical protein B7494_g2696 [Chlorociboria aeruginascens]|nr:hypothetical protein B7494_g2696 [Chlorociboria aeruginascens]